MQVKNVKIEWKNTLKKKQNVITVPYSLNSIEECHKPNYERLRQQKYIIKIGKQNIKTPIKNINKNMIRVWDGTLLVVKHQDSAAKSPKILFVLLWAIFKKKLL